MGTAAPADRRALAAEQLRELLQAFESGDHARFDSGIETLTRERQETLFSQVARLTRELHDAVSQMRLDERLARIAGDDIPDARHRLDYVMQVTEKAAHRTLDLVEQARGVTAGILHAADRLDVAAEAVVGTGAELPVCAVRRDLRRHAGFLRDTLSELAQAQEYQDISGQIIKKVITLVRNVETALLELLRSAGGGLQPAAARPIQPLSGELAGPAVPGTAAASQQDADELLANLGF